MLVAWWLCFGLYGVVEGILDAWEWHTGPFFEGMSLRWWHSTHIIPGAIGIAYAAGLVAKWRFYRVFGYIVAAFFVFDHSVLLVLTTDAGRMSAWGAWTAFVVVVSLATIAFNIRLSLNASRQSGKTGERYLSGPLD
jgi:hypothetical protein